MLENVVKIIQDNMTAILPLFAGKEEMEVVSCSAFCSSFCSIRISSVPTGGSC